MKKVMSIRFYILVESCDFNYSSPSSIILILISLTVTILLMMPPYILVAILNGAYAFQNDCDHIFL